MPCVCNDLNAVQGSLYPFPAQHSAIGNHEVDDMRRLLCIRQITTELAA